MLLFVVVARCCCWLGLLIRRFLRALSLLCVDWCCVFVVFLLFVVVCYSSLFVVVCWCSLLCVVACCLLLFVGAGWWLFVFC